MSVPPAAQSVTPEPCITPAAAATGAGASEKLTSGQKWLAGLFIVGCVVVLGSAMLGDAKSIRIVARIAGTVVAFGVLASVAALVRRVRRWIGGA